jgi:hypothetical protein
VLAPTPQSLVTEGIAKLGPPMLLAGEGGAALTALVHDAGVELDLGLAGEPERFRRLLTEQVRVRDLRAARDSAG